MMMVAATELDDRYDHELVAAVHPPTWKNPSPVGRYNLVVIGGGTAGLVSAIGAASLGARVALVERHRLGGDCLNYGCVPSKALLRATRAAHDARSPTIDEFGVASSAAPVDFSAVMRRMRRLRAQLAPHDSAERCAGLGIDVYFGAGRFIARDTIEVDGVRLVFARCVIATGARASVPKIPGLSDAAPLTNETVFSLTELPRRLLVVGGGPIGCELAQAFGRLGSKVTLIGRDDRLLPREDPDASRILKTQFEREGIRLLLGAKLVAAERTGPTSTLTLLRAGTTETCTGDAILIAAGRTPNLDGLGLEIGGIATTERGIEVDDHLRTTNRRVYAAGDVASRFHFTHAADAMARIVIQNALLFGRKRATALVMPWCTHTDPEIAHVGLSEREARAQHGNVTTFTVELADNDRAVLDGETIGFGRVHIDRRGRLLGATLVARHAGESIGEASLAITTRQKLAALSSTIHPYPTQAEVWKRLGDAYQTRRLTPRLRALFRWLLRRRR